MNLSYLNKLTSFTNINTNMKIDKNAKFMKNRPECL